MLDNALFALIFSILKSGLQSVGLGNVTLLQNYQPQVQGTPSNPTIFIYKIGPDELMGFPAVQGLSGAGSATFTGSITGLVLTVTSMASGTIEPSQIISGVGVGPDICVTGQINGTPGGAGTYSINQSPADVPLETMTTAAAYCNTQTQQYISLFQASALAAQDPSNVNALTASDILNYAAMVLQSPAAIAAFEAQGVGILKITQARNPYFTDDRERYEASPSFDFSLTHKQVVTTVGAVVTSDVLQILSV